MQLAPGAGLLANAGSIGSDQFYLHMETPVYGKNVELLDFQMWYHWSSVPKGAEYHI